MLHLQNDDSGAFSRQGGRGRKHLGCCVRLIYKFLNLEKIQKYGLHCQISIVMEVLDIAIAEDLRKTCSAIYRKTKIGQFR